MDFTPLSDATHVSASFYLNSALIGFELLPVVGSDPVARLAEMIAHVAAELTVTVPGVGD